LVRLAEQVLGAERLDTLRELRGELQSARWFQHGMHVLDSLRAIVSSNSRLWYDDILSVCPHPPGMYRYVLECILASGTLRCVLARDLHAGQLDDTGAYLVLRHDLDACPERTAIFVRAERQAGVRSSCYVRVDGERYEPERVARLVRELHEEGFEVGLHTAAYARPQPFAELACELRRFLGVFGFPVRSVTTHGFTMRRAVQRQRRLFVSALARRADRYGLIVTDHIVPGVYTVQVGDAKVAFAGRRRYLSRDVLRLAQAPAGTRALFLTHPEYWLDEA
jgi:hypothetical protein